MKLSVLEGNKISHGLIISHDTDEQDFTPHHREDKAAQTQQNWTFSTALNDVVLSRCFFNLGGVKAARGGNQIAIDLTAWSCWYGLFSGFVL